MSDEPNRAATAAEPFRDVIRIDEGQLHHHLDAVVHDSVEQTLNALLDRLDTVVCDRRDLMFDITPYLWSDDPWLRIEPTGNIRACYSFKHTVGLLLQLSSILEIGVRAGYAAAAFLTACPQASYYGVDADNRQHGGVPGAVAWARAMLARHFPGRSLRIDAPLDTRQQEPAGSDYDLAHVDGDHSFAGCLHDLELAARLGCKWILVDDIDYLPPVRQAVELFIGRTGYRHLFLPSFRGDCLIRTRAGDDLEAPGQRRSAASLARQSPTTAAGRSSPNGVIPQR